MPLSPLGSKIYDVLRQRLSQRAPQITYAELAKAIGSGMVARNAHLVAALFEIAYACRAAGLPIVTAIVVQKTNGKPSTGYLEVAGERRNFMLDIEEAKRASYPDTL